jgi:hypothetical protein
VPLPPTPTQKVKTNTIVLGKCRVADIINVDEDKSGDNDEEAVDEFGLFLVSRKVSVSFLLRSIQC